MNATGGQFIIGLAVTAAVNIAIGVFYLIRGRRGVRVGFEPFCSRCGYSLRGLPDKTPACPECGSDLSKPKAIVEGRWQPRHVSLIFGVVILLSGLGLLGVAGRDAYRQFEWMHYTPAGFLVDRAAKSPPDMKAVAELQRRLKAGDLARRHVDKVVSVALAMQQNRAGRFDRTWARVIESARDANQLADADWKRYIEQMSGPKLHVTPSGRDTKWVAIDYDTQPRRIGDTLAGFWVEYSNFSINGERASAGRYEARAGSQGRGGTWSHSGVSSAVISKPLPPGTYSLEYDVSADWYLLGDTGDVERERPKTPPLISKKWRQKGEFVVPATQPANPEPPARIDSY